MALSNYSELKTAIANTINRDDLTTHLDQFITLAESRIARDLVKSTELQVTTTMTVDAQSEDLPADFSAMVRATFGGTKPTLDYLPSDSFWDRYGSSTTGTPIAYTIEGNAIKFMPSPDASMTLNYTYIAKPDIATDDTNRLLTVRPDVYLFACLSEAADFILDDERYAKYEARYQKAVRDVVRASQYSGPLTQKVSVP